MKVCPECKRSFGEEDFRVCPADGASLIDETASVNPMLGRVLDNRFRIVEEIGKGGMGVVYKAVQIQMDRICALKLLAPLTIDSESAVARFRREARMSSRIDSPNAVTIYDFGEAETGLLYLAMEYIEGESLADVLMRERYLPLERVVDITNQTARALAAAHALGIVHRDLKPANVMLSRKNVKQEVVKVLDFGIAKTWTDNKDESLTQTGTLVGTPSYMSPEQVAGDVVDARTDVYSLSVMVYEMLTGELPFDGNNARTQMVNRLNHEPKPLRRTSPSLTDAVEFVVLSGLAREPAQRTANAQEFAAALSAAARAVSISESPTLLRKGTAGSSTANDPSVLSESESTTTRVSPRIEINVSEQDRVPASQPKVVRPLSILIPLFVIAVVLFVTALLSAGGYYIYSRSRQTTEPIAAGSGDTGAPGDTGAGGPARQTSLPSTDSTKQSSINADAASYYAEGKRNQKEARNEAAVAAYRKAIAIQPNFAEAHENLAVALYDLGKPGEAITEFELAIRQYETPTAQVWANYGMALLVTRRFQDAAAAFGKSAALNPKDAELYYYRAFALHFAGDLRGSRIAFTEYLNVAPTGEHAKDVEAILSGRATPSLDSIVAPKEAR